MATWGTERTRIRRNLNDPQQKRWTDEELDDYAVSFFEDISLRFPRRGRVTLNITAGVGEYSLPLTISDIRVVQFISTDGLNQWTLDERVWLPGTPLTVHQGDPKLYEVMAGQLFLYPVPTRDATLVLHADMTFAGPESPDDELTIPPVAYQALRYFVKHQAYEKQELARANLAQFEDSDKNPLTPVTRHYWRQYTDAVARLDQHHHVQLHR